jgi:hypothetical protein
MLEAMAWKTNRERINEINEICANCHRKENLGLKICYKWKKDDNERLKKVDNE